MMPEHGPLGEARLRVPDRSQFTMETTCPDDLVAAGHRVRVVWDVVCRLDLSALHASVKAREGRAGRDATDPRLLVSLWLYAATRGVGSARELARLCGESRPYRWLCGGVTVNHRLLGEFRVGHAAVLDGLFTQVVASLVRQGLVTVSRIAQDGTRVRAFAGQKSFRSGERLDELLTEARRHVEELRGMLDDGPSRSGGPGRRRRAARERAARDRVRRVEAAVAELPELERRQVEAVKKLGGGKVGRARAAKKPRASTTDPEARVMRMPGGEFRPAYNVQLAADTASRAIVGVGVVNAGADAGQAGPMRDQVQRRTGRHVDEHLLDGGYLVLAEVDRSRDGTGEDDVTLYVPPKPPRDKLKRGSEYEPRPTDTPAVRAWRARMGGDEGKRVYGRRGSTIETVNADLKTHRGLGRLAVRGIGKVTCVALWSALAYNVLHFGPALTA